MTKVTFQDQVMKTALDLLLNDQTNVSHFIFAVPVPRDDQGRFDFTEVQFIPRHMASEQEVTDYDKWVAEHRDEFQVMRTTLARGEA